MDITFNEKILEAIHNIFPLLNGIDQNYLADKLFGIINRFILRTSVNTTSLKIQLLQNNSLDIKSFLKIIIPYIYEEDDTGKNKTTLRTLEELSTTRTTDASNSSDANVPIGKIYKYTNIQFDRCIRIKQGSTEIIERPYYNEYVEHNYQLLLETIDLVANQLYVNWIDVVPVRLDQMADHHEMRNSDVYQNHHEMRNPDVYQNHVTLLNQKLSSGTQELIDGMKQTYEDPLAGISMNVIFQTIHNIYYQVKPIKWLLFDIMETGDSGLVMTDMYHYLIERLPIELNEWDNLSVNQKNDFQQKWAVLLEDRRIVSNFFYYFTKFYQNKTDLINRGLLGVIDDEDPDDLNHRYVVFDYDEAKAMIQNIPYTDIHRFLVSQIQTYQKTIYAKMSHQNIDGRWLSPKNYYNYCKSLVHQNKIDKQEVNIYQEMPRFWSSLDADQIEIFMTRLLIDNTWFNINGNLRQLLGLKDTELRDYNNWIFQTIKADLASFIIRELIYNGLLSVFVPHPNVTNEDLYSNNIRQSQLSQMGQTTLSNWNTLSTQCYYYLTNETYPNDYIKYLLSLDNGFSFSHSLNWVTQIDFYHKYWNNRVIFVTGGTGTGKSTQVPKLTLFAQKMLFKKFNSKIFCTEPRVAPTVSNAGRIAVELGYPIISNDSPTNNFYVQYKHKGESHTNEQDYFIRLLTDGTLRDTLIKFPFLTTTNPLKPYVFEGGYPIIDVVMVDEAHEHNSNMDLILTFMRDICYVNNQVKLVIISATMDNDEPIYRRYYRDINDNLIYPISMKNKVLELDRVNVDRRIDLSKPGRSTQYKITHHYEKENIPYDKYLKVLSNMIVMTVPKKSGDALAFVTGEKDIKTLVADLNTKLPPNVLAFPFYSRLAEISPADSEFVRTLTKETLRNYRRNREDVFLNAKVVKRTVPAGTYSQIVIIATNIAEASLTLPTLTMVFDSGYVKSEIYDSMINMSVPKIVQISYSSAVQRSGRVGRVANGDSYHLYTYDSIKNNMIPYNITNENFQETFIRLLQEKENDYPIMNKNNNFLSVTKLLQCFHSHPNGIFTRKELGQILLYDDEIIDIIAKQYNYRPYYESSIEMVFYLGVNGGPAELSEMKTKQWMLANHDDYYYARDYWESRYHSGWSGQQLKDVYYNFYIIHPDENNIIRDPLSGVVIAIKPDKYRDFYIDLNPGMEYQESERHQTTSATTPMNGNDRLKILNVGKPIVSPRMEILLYYLAIEMYAFKVPYNIVDKHAHIDLDKKEEMILKTEMTRRFQHIKYQTDLPSEYLYDWRYLSWYCYAVANGVENEVIGLISILKSMNSLHHWIQMKTGKLDVSYLNFLRNNRNRQGDIHFAWMLWKQIDGMMKKTDFVNNPVFDRENIRKLFEVQNQDYKKGILTGYGLKIFKKMAVMNQLNKEDSFDSYLRNYQIEIVSGDELDTISSDTATIIASMYGFPKDEVRMAINNYFKNYFLSLKKSWNSTEDFDWIKVHLNLPSPFPQTSTWDKILTSYLRAFSTQLVYNDNGVLKMAVTGNPINIYKVIVKYQSEYDTLLANEWKSYVFYSTIATRTAVDIIWLQPFDFQWLVVLSPVFFEYLKHPLFNNAKTATLSNLTHLNDLDELQRYVEILDDPIVTAVFNKAMM